MKQLHFKIFYSDSEDSVSMQSEGSSIYSDSEESGSIQSASSNTHSDSWIDEGPSVADLIQDYYDKNKNTFMQDVLDLVSRQNDTSEYEVDEENINDFLKFTHECYQEKKHLEVPEILNRLMNSVCEEALSTISASEKFNLNKIGPARDKKVTKKFTEDLEKILSDKARTFSDLLGANSYQKAILNMNLLSVQKGLVAYFEKLNNFLRKRKTIIKDKTLKKRRNYEHGSGSDEDKGPGVMHSINNIVNTGLNQSLA